MISNHKPYLNSYDKAMIDRMKLLPFNTRFEDTPENNKKVKDLQADINYFFSYLVRKAKDYYANPFLVKNIPKVVQEATSQIIQDNDYLGDFIKENFVMEYDYLKAKKSHTIWSNIMKKNLKYIQDNYDSSLKNYGLYVKVMYSFYTKKFERPLKKSEFLKKLFTKDFSQTYTNFNSLLYKEYRIAFKCVLDESEKLELEFDVDEEEIQELEGNTDDEGRQHFIFFASYQQQRERERERERERKEREKERQGKQPKEVDSDTDLD
jgi:phage/plasmid-associated DNA primase